MAETFTESEVLAELREAIEDAGSQKAFAAKVGVSLAYVNDMLRGHRAIQGKVLTALGFERRTVFVELPKPPADPEGRAP